MYETDMYEGMIAETVMMQGANGDTINAYYARPLGPGPFPGMVIVHHLPGWDAWYKEATRLYAAMGYTALSPNLYYRLGHGTPEDVGAKARSMGGVPDDQALGDMVGAMEHLRAQPYLNGKVGIWGTCSGGRHSFLAACRSDGFDAAIDCWGGRVVMPPDTLTENYPVSPLEYTADLSCPLLGIFGNDDHSPKAENVNILEAELKKHGKAYEFHRYDDAGHGFFYHHRPNYRQAQAVDGWNKIWDFLGRHLA